MIPNPVTEPGSEPPQTQDIRKYMLLVICVGGISRGPSGEGRNTCTASLNLKAGEALRFKEA
eukprot:11051836-Alexandrium_andersonii.AAC.1